MAGQRRKTRYCGAANDLCLDLASHCVSTGDILLEMGLTEYRLLEFLMSHTERVYSRRQRWIGLGVTKVYVEERTVDVHIWRLRKVLEPNGHDALI